MMHILNHNFSKHGYFRDATRVSNIISKYLQIKETSTMNTTFNNFSYLFFIQDKDIQTDQPFINLSGYIQQISQILINQQFSEEFHSGSESLKHLFGYFNYPEVDEITRLHQAQNLIDELSDQDLRGCLLSSHFRRLESAGNEVLNDTEHNLLVLLKLFFLFRNNVTEPIVQQFVLRQIS
jgi:hypothetical protein